MTTPSVATIDSGAVSKVERLEWIQVARGLACLMVVLLHVCTSYLAKYGVIPLASWIVADLVNSSLRSCVPIFFMISGFLFFRERSPTARNFYRLIAALLFYSLLAILYRLAVGEAPGKVAYEHVRLLPVTPVFYHLWFFYALVCVYLMAYLVKVREDRSGAYLIALFVALFALNPSLGTLRILATGKEADAFKFMGFLDGTIIYYVLCAVAGAAIGTLQGAFRHAIPRWGLVACFVVCSVAIAIFTFLESTARGAFGGRFFEYSNILVLGAGVCLFALLRFHIDATSMLSRCLSWIGEHSLAIYGVHALVLDYINVRGLRRLDLPWLDLPAVWLVVVVASIAMALGIRAADRRRLVT